MHLRMVVKCSLACVTYAYVRTYICASKHKMSHGVDRIRVIEGHAKRGVDIWKCLEVVSFHSQLTQMEFSEAR